MFGLVVLIAATVFMYRLAAFSNESPFKWAAINFGLCLIISLFLPYPFIGTLLGMGICYGLMCFKVMRA